MGKQKRYKQSDINPKGGNTGDVIKTTETNTQLEIPNLYKGIKKANQIRNAYLARSAVNPMEKNGIKTRNYWAREILW